MSLLLHYKFDRTDIVLDSSGNGKNLTNIGGVRAITDGKYGVVARFTGSNYFTLSNADNRPHGSPRTVSVWVNRSKKSQQTVFDIGKLRHERLIGYWNYTDQFRFYGSNSTSKHDHPNSELGRWYHMVFVYDGPNVTGYQDGVMTHTKPSGYNSSHNPITGLYIGRLSNANTYFFNGSMTDFRYYDYVLTPEQVSLLYSNGPGEAVPLIPKIPASIQVQEKTSSKIKFLIEGDPNSTYKLEVAGQTVENIKDGDTVDVDGLQGDTQYTSNLY